MINRRNFVAGSLCAAVGGIIQPPLVQAQLVQKSARMLVGFPAGGSIDVVARLLVEQMKGYAPNFVVDNRPGAGGRLALDSLKASDADGSVMILTPGDQLTLFPHIYRKLGYDPLKDFVAVTTVCSVEFLLTVGPMVPDDVKTLAQFVQWCRANPARATYGTPGAGSRPHFLGVMFSQAVDVPLVHAPYKGGALAIQDLLGGQIPMTISVLSNTLPHLAAGKLRALATTAPRRSAVLPDVQTFREAGYSQLEALEWFGILVPANTPSSIVNGLSSAVRAAVESTEVKAAFSKLAFEPSILPSAEFIKAIGSEFEHWGSVVRITGFTPID